MVCSAAAQAEDLCGGNFAIDPAISVSKLPTPPALNSCGGVPNKHKLYLVAKHGDALGHSLLGLPVITQGPKTPEARYHNKLLYVRDRAVSIVKVRDLPTAASTSYSVH